MSDASWTALISAGSGLLGTFIGGWITYRTQTALQGATEKRLRKSVAAALGAEIDAYLDLIDRRQWEVNLSRDARGFAERHRPQVSRRRQSGLRGG